MAKQVFKIEGLSDLDKLLSELPKATQRNTLLRVLKKAGQPIADKESELAPKLTGELAMSPIVSTKLSRRQRKMHRKESPVEVYVGPTPHPKSVQTEFGNAHQAAEPHLRPAWDAGAMPALNSIKGDLKEEIGKSVARLARKAQRDAAKMK